MLELRKHTFLWICVLILTDVRIQVQVPGKFSHSKKDALLCRPPMRVIREAAFPMIFLRERLHDLSPFTQLPVFKKCVRVSEISTAVSRGQNWASLGKGFKNRDRKPHLHIKLHTDKPSMFSR